MYLYSSIIYRIGDQRIGAGSAAIASRRIMRRSDVGLADWKCQELAYRRLHHQAAAEQRRGRKRQADIATPLGR